MPVHSALHMLRFVPCCKATLVPSLGVEKPGAIVPNTRISAFFETKCRLNGHYVIVVCKWRSISGLYHAGSMRESFVFTELDGKILTKNPQTSQYLIVNRLPFITANPSVSCSDALELHGSSLFKKPAIHQLKYIWWTICNWLPWKGVANKLFSLWCVN